MDFTPAFSHRVSRERLTSIQCIRKISTSIANQKLWDTYQPDTTDNENGQARSVLEVFGSKDEL